MVVAVTNSQISIAGHLVVQLCDGRWNRMRVQVTGGGSMDQTNHVPVREERKWCIRIVGLVPGGMDDPVVVGIFVVVASDLLLLRASWECLYVGMKQASAPSHILEC